MADDDTQPQARERTDPDANANDAAGSTRREPARPHALDLFSLPAEQREQVLEACHKEGLDGSYVHFVARHLDVPDRDWRSCCASSCDPCVQTLGRAVDRARQALCMTPPGTPTQGSDA